MSKHPSNMQVIFIVPSAGTSYYCQNCLRDYAWIRGLRELGVDAVLIPMYLPVLEHIEHSPIFYNAMEVFLQQKLPWIQKFPAWIHRILNWPKLLQCISRSANSASSHGMEELTLSLLKGAQGNHHVQLKELLDYLSQLTPTLVHLSNALLLGLAKPIQQSLQVPVICSLQDEDQWINPMSSEYQPILWNALKEKAKDAAGFISVSRYYRNFMQQKLAFPDDRVEVIYPGLDPNSISATGPQMQPPTIGYLSRWCSSLGLDQLIQAFYQLKQEPALSNLRLMVIGGFAKEDQAMLAQIRQNLVDMEYADAVEWKDNFSQAARHHFFQHISVLCVPAPQGEAFGLYQLEAWLHGIPVVEPNLAAFAEIVSLGQGGLLYEPNDSKNLAHALRNILTDPTYARMLGQNGRLAIETKFSVHSMAMQTMAFYNKILQMENRK